MKKIIFFITLLTLYGCNNPKTVLICGDHVCINKAEAEQYFEENLTLEVQIIDNKKDKKNDLVELNLNKNLEGKKEISVTKRNKIKKKIKILSNDEIEKKKIEVRNKKKLKVKKKEKNKIVKTVKKIDPNKTKKKIKKITKDVDKSENKIKDICTILEKCSIDEISEYLVKQGKTKKFPDITNRDN
tara:strand:- start:1042 stop:1599 length:558 start_codon:yes stop_codon:yes gene_type:complete